MPDPIEVLLKFAFLGILYVFLLWVARSALKDLGRPVVQPVRSAEMPLEQAADSFRFPRLVAQHGGGLRAGESFDIAGELTIGRSPASQIQVDDSFASTRHARIYERNGSVYVEDMNSTNGTYLNGRRMEASEPLVSGDELRIGDTEFLYEE